jgi:putative solute:sodium symporter small subunit
MPNDAARQRHWRRTLALTAALLAVGFAVSFVVPWFARDLDFDFLGWPFSYWVASQGALLVFLIIVWVYAWAMDRVDGELGADEAGDPPQGR